MINEYGNLVSIMVRPSDSKIIYDKKCKWCLNSKKSEVVFTDSKPDS
jgi:hypothetical protein